MSERAREAYETFTREELIDEIFDYAEGASVEAREADKARARVVKLEAALADSDSALVLLALEVDDFDSPDIPTAKVLGQIKAAVVAARDRIDARSAAAPAGPERP